MSLFPRTRTPGRAEFSEADMVDATWSISDNRVPRGRRFYLTLKRALDVVIATALLIVLTPVFGVIALAVLLDSPGPPLFRQTRIGELGYPFEMLKFRTMIRERRVRGGSPPPGIADRRRVHKSPYDPRVTRVGRVLRRTCLDELPQLWNVLCGDMSLVGPRPELPEIVQGYEEWQHARHLVPPGITGWWQVNRDERLMHQATELDLYYIQHQSFRFDVIIVAKTVGVLIRGIGAF
jgi:lipopolysaccharide/colanic/teichoic acid biosynthesis glycosyltransferase